MSDRAVLPMFPLGTVLFPYAVLPIHVFEPRYRALALTCLSGDREFGVVLIERGHEVGGGDQRFNIGTVARIVQSEALDDGGYILVVVGTDRLRVVDWLPDDPFPQAEVVRVAEPPPSDAKEARSSTRASLHELYAMLAQRGLEVPELVVHDDPVRASFETASLALLGPLDAQRVLALDDPAERLRFVDAEVRARIELLRRG